jgi:hypothetical protein
MVAAFLGTVAASGNAQLSVSTGLKIGLSNAQFGGSDVKDNAALKQYCAGVSLELDLPGPLAIEADVLYSMKGTHADVSSPSPYTDKLSYIEIPILLKYTLPVPVLNPFIGAGPAFGLFLDGTRQFEGAGAGTPDVSVRDLYSKSDYAAVIAAGISIPIIITDLSVEARYYYGFQKVLKAGTPNAVNRVASLLVGITL